MFYVYVLKLLPGHFWDKVWIFLVKTDCQPWREVSPYA